MAIRFYVAGVKHHDLEKVIDMIQDGDELEMVPEPTNPYDANAIKLLYEPEMDDFEGYEKQVKVMVGYVPAKIAAKIIGHLDDLSVVVAEVNPGEKPWSQLKVELLGGPNA